MKPPKHVDVGPHRYRVLVVNDGVLGDAGEAGHTTRTRLVIALDGEQPASLLADTLCHELGHALLAPVGLETEVEERVALALGPGLLALIRDNNRLIDWVRSL